MRKIGGMTGLGALFAVMMFVLSGIPVGADEDCVCEYGKEVKLIAGKSINAGNIVVTHDTDDLHIKITTSGSWWISEYHVAAAMTFGGIPQNKNNPQPGQFPYSDDVWTQSVVVDIPFDEIEDFVCCEMIYIAVHTVVKQLDKCGKVIQEQTAWGEGKNPWKNWAMYFTYCPTKMLNLPAGDEINVNYIDYRDGSYWTVSFPDYTDDSSPYYYLNQYGTDWCIETGQYISKNNVLTPYDMELISTIGLSGFVTYRTYNSQDPVTVPPSAWNEINWLVNNDDGHSLTDVQYVIWALVGILKTDGTALPTSSEGTLYWKASGAGAVGQGAIDLYNEAVQHPNFYPCCGELEVVIIHSDTYQDTIVEVDP